MDDVARFSPRERADLFNEAAARRGLVSAIIEKDFWACWTLKRIFALPGDNPTVVFKGGTSLSKAYGVIRRFSEDIDLSFDRHNLGYTGQEDPQTAPSRKKAEELLERLDTSVLKHIDGVFVPRLEEAIAAALPGQRVWRLEKDPADPKTIILRYPSSLTAGTYGAIQYVNPVVRLELGARGDPWPTERRPIRSYAAEEFPAVFREPTADVTVLAAERTFWEKATLLHAEYHRPVEKLTGDRLSRHYYDLALLADTPYGERALQDLRLLGQVAEQKARFFASGWANYHTAKPGTLRLVPPESRMSALGGDYEKMKPMFFDEPPPFATLIRRLRELEDKINAG